jgi:hypothetical protein
VRRGGVEGWAIGWQAALGGGCGCLVDSGVTQFEVLWKEVDVPCERGWLCMYAKKKGECQGMPGSKVDGMNG